MLSHFYFKILFFIIIITLEVQPACTFAQIGGSNTYQFLDLPNSARIAALGGNVVSIKENDINLALQNPSLLNVSMHEQLALSGVRYLADIKYGYAAYCRNFKKYGTYQAAIHFIHYGSFQYADPTGVLTGENFTAGEYLLNFGWGLPIDSFFSVGTNLKTIYSSLEQNTSLGLAADIAATYNNTKHLYTLALVVKNLGRQVKAYRPDNVEPLPFEIQLGASLKPRHMPLRLSLLARHLQQYDLTYIDPNKSIIVDPVSGVSEEQKFSTIDKIMRHLVFGGELLISKNFNIRLGYNYQRRQELGFETKMKMAGFSWGFGFRISKFHLSYARASYNAAGASDYFTITTNLNQFHKPSGT